MVHLRLPHLRGNQRREGGTEATTPKGWVAIRVGRDGDEEQQRFVVPVAHLNHPLFMGLLKEAEEEYGFEHKGAITIPCHVECFHRVQGIIDRECNGHSAVGGGQHPNFHLCFKA